MPHAGLMHEGSMGPEEGPLLRARLHIRGGRRRLRQGKVAAGIATLADALNAALEWYAASPERRNAIGLRSEGDALDERALYRALVRSEKVSGRFDYNTFDLLTVRSFSEDLLELDYRPLLAAFEELMAEMGVMPFDEEALPREDPRTF